MDSLSDELLIESYFEARRLRLSQDFIHLIEEELKARNLDDVIQ